MKIETIRNSYKPRKIKLLLIGESAPVSNKFFYIKSAMTTYTAQAFEKAYDVSFDDTKSFLDYFKNNGCYLDDLSLIPVNAMTNKDREKTLNASVHDLSKRILKADPEIVVTALQKIEPYIREAINLSGLKVTFKVLPFAGNSHQNLYVAGLTNILKQYLPAKT